MGVDKTNDIKLKVGELKTDNWPISKLIHYAKNPRKNDEQVDRMCESIREFGFRIPVIAKSDGTVVDGHLRLKAAKKLGMKSVPVALADELTDQQVKAFRLLANRSANWAEWDMPMLAEEMESLARDGYDLGLTGFGDSEVNDILSAMDINFSGELADGIDGGGFGAKDTRVKVVLDAGCVESLERAIAKTGQFNRMDAVREICEAYLAQG